MQKAVKRKLEAAISSSTSRRTVALSGRKVGEAVDQKNYLVSD